MATEVAVVTGASEGLGRAIAFELAKRGVAVAVSSRRLEACRMVADAIEAAGGVATAHACDVSLPEDVRRLVAEVVDAHGRVDVLVNNAGTIEPIARLGDIDNEEWRRSLEVNVCGPLYAVQEVLPHFRSQGGGVVVNISSGAAHSPREGWSAYCAGKAALAMLTRSIAHELADEGVLSYGFQPGVVDTEMQAVIRASGINEVSRIPREQLAPAEAPARLVALLCVGKPAHLNGHDLSIRDDAAVAAIEASVGATPEA